MSKQLVKNPAGSYNVFCSSIDDWVLQNASEEEIYAFFRQEAIDWTDLETKRRFNQIEQGKNIISYEEAVEQILRVRDEVNELFD